MSAAVLPFFGARHEIVPPLEVTITKRGHRWLMAFVDGGELQPCAPVGYDDIPIISYVSEYFARAAVWAYARKWINENHMAVIYRSDLETG